MTDNTNTTIRDTYCAQHCTPSCPPSCPCPILLDIVTSIAHQEDALACILNAECAKINKILDHHDDAETLIAIDTSVQVTIQRITELEGVLKAKLDSIIPLLHDCV